MPSEIELAPILAAGVRAAIPLSLSSLGELITERSGVINLGVEGIMLLGALAGAATAAGTGSATAGVLAAAAVGAVLAGSHAIVCVWLAANQIASGTAILMLGTGLSAFIGIRYVGVQFPTMPLLPIPLLADIPVLGPMLFNQDWLAYAALLLAPVTVFLLGKTRWGLHVRAVGDDPGAAEANGIDVRTTRTAATVLGGALAGIAGGYLSIVYANLWLENMVAGRGLIALAIVTFGRWRPMPVLFGCLLFGTVNALQISLQAAGSRTSPYLLSMFPYVLTIAVLVVAALRMRRLGVGAPSALGVPYTRMR